MVLQECYKTYPKKENVFIKNEGKYDKTYVMSIFESPWHHESINALIYETDLWIQRLPRRLTRRHMLR